MSSYRQPPLFQDHDFFHPPFPSTRYQGSKRKLAQWIWESLNHLSFDTVLDAFGGTGAVSHYLKAMGKQVTYNDRLRFNWSIGVALIQNSGVTLKPHDVAALLETHDVEYPDFIQRTFKDIYFYADENAWLDRTLYNIRHFLDDPYKQALARFALFQACITKRPYNLFHRANLYMRSAEVERSFGNKNTWDTPFEAHFRSFVDEANAAVFDNGRENRALNLDVMDAPTGANLVYLDPPYLNAQGKGVDYREFYHFLEGMMNYDTWEREVDFKSKHRRLRLEPSLWLQPKTINAAFEAVIERYAGSILVISYRSDGIPSEDELVTMLKRYKGNVEKVAQAQKYVLSNRESHELLLIAS